jgi:hypothetical protein
MNNATAIFKAFPTFDIFIIYPSFMFYHKTFHLALQNGGTQRSDWHSRPRSQHELIVGRATIFLIAPRYLSFEAPRYL